MPDGRVKGGSKKHNDYLKGYEHMFFVSVISIEWCAIDCTNFLTTLYKKEGVTQRTRPTILVW